METENWIGVGSAVTAVGATVIAWWQARIAKRSVHLQLDDAQQARREQSEPYVIVDIRPFSDPGSRLLVLVVENIGPTMARNVRIGAEPELESTLGEEITATLRGVLSRPFPMIPPGRLLEFPFDNADRFSSDLPTRYEFTVDADGPHGSVEQMKYPVDFGTWSGSLSGERPTRQLETQVQKIAGELKLHRQQYEMANREEIRAGQRARYEAVMGQRRPAEENSEGAGS